MGERTLNAWAWANSFWGLSATALGIAVAFANETLGAALLASAGLIFTFFLNPIAAIVVMLCVAPLRTLVATEAPGLLPLDVGQIAFAAVIASWVLHVAVRRRSLQSLLPLNPILLALGSFLVASGLSAFSAFSTQDWLTEWLKWFQILLLGFLLVEISRDYGWRWIVFGLVTAALANALIGIYEYYGGSGALHLLIDEEHFRAFGTFGQPNPFAGFMGIAAPIAVMAGAANTLQSWNRYRETQRVPASVGLAVFYIIAACVISYALYVSFSRGAWLAFAASLALVVMAIPRQKWVSLGIILVSAIGIGVIITSGRLPSSISARLSTVTDEFASAGDVRGVDVSAENYANVERLAHWQAAVNMATAHPLTGVGFGNYEAAYPQFSLLYWRLALGHAHNYYLNVLAETGMIGALAYGALIVTTIIAVWRLRRHPDNNARMMSIGLLGSFTYLAIHSLTDNLYVNNLFLHIGVLFALVAILHDQLYRITHV